LIRLLAEAVGCVWRASGPGEAWWAVMLVGAWSYSAKTLTNTLELNSDGLAYVVNDNLGDSCQRMS
jgi:hypothetical protein